MNLVALLYFLSISLTISSIVPIGSPKLEDLLSELEEMEFSNSRIIDIYFSLKNFYERNKSLILLGSDEYLDLASKFHLNLSRYHRLINNFYFQSPIECLQMVRLYGNFELAYLFTSYLFLEKDVSDFDDLEVPLFNISRFKELETRFKKLRYQILSNYGTIAKEILHKPFGAQPGNTVSMNFKIGNSYNAVEDWEKRKEILKEIIIAFKTLWKLAVHLGRNEFVPTIKKKIEKFEFIIAKFQIDQNGPSSDHFLSLFYQIRHLSRDEHAHKLSPNFKKLFSVFRIYSKHMTDFQLVDPSLFPKPMLAIVSRRILYKENIFNLFICRTDQLIPMVVDSLREGQISEISSRIMNGKNPSWHNLINSYGILNPRENWIIKVYLTLLIGYE
jgi:hypothetical protein